VKKLAIFGSGTGSNAENICNYFANSSSVEVVFICTNSKNALIVKRAKKLSIPVVYTTKYGLANFTNLKKILQDYKVSYIILAGFLLKIPSEMVDSYPNRIINIHPSLLPKYGGKGMYGRNVHKAVLENNESESGITVHFVNENYDDGGVFLQKRCAISVLETTESLEKKIRSLELEYFPKTIEKILSK
jgi:phosphoribosylglycinamide formyltransferase-1